ncbi:MAG: hypothetical protein RPR40_10025 [Bermanella sp.]
MSHLTDAKLDSSLNAWAMWVVGGSNITGLGYKPQSIDQTFVQLNQSSHSAIYDNSLQEIIERAVSMLAVRDREAADVGRMEYGAHKRSHNPTYDKPNQKRNAGFLGIGLSKYKRKLADFRLSMWMVLTDSRPEEKTA